MISAEQLYEKLRHVTLGGTTCLYTLEKCRELAPLVNRINQLKKEKNAVILAHSYVSPDIVSSVADFVGDSYELSKNAKASTADTIVFAAVRFMAETAKILNPTKTVLIPSKNNGCTLADSITAVQVAELKAQYPDYTFICYINTSAAVKALCDVCVTSSNVYDIVQHHPNSNIYFLPDKLMGKNLMNEMQARGVQKDIRFWEGVCYVHEQYDVDMIRYVRSTHPSVKVVSHPECDESILENSDYVGSTSQMISYVKNSPENEFFMLTECGLTSRLQLEAPGKKFIGTCTMCRFMKSNTLADILRVLESPEPSDVVHLEPTVQQNALKCIEAMFEFNATSH